jgi:hypothetical protein
MLNRMKVKEVSLPITSCEFIGSFDYRVGLSSNLDDKYSLDLAKEKYNTDNSYKVVYLSLGGVSTVLTVDQLEELVVTGQSMINYIKGEL